MDKKTLQHIRNIKSAFVGGKFDASKVKDDLSYRISLTYIDNMLRSGQMTEAEFKKTLRSTKK